MTEPQIVCPKCRTEIKLTESLAEPLVAETWRRFEQQLAAREVEFGHRACGWERSRLTRRKFATGSAMRFPMLALSSPSHIRWSSRAMS
ncbi:hypothetical protein [Bradyrhizobium japonicum]|uniref:hypothetical protein n=1 Tax=Bradyrhizobium japonicum TaxID=375 RepID=UPI000462C8C0|nr:hypothetical protein [Bradyrhizobium japonicum]